MIEQTDVPAVDEPRQVDDSQRPRIDSSVPPVPEPSFVQEPARPPVTPPPNEVQAAPTPSALISEAPEDGAQAEKKRAPIQQPEDGTRPPRTRRASSTTPPAEQPAGLIVNHVRGRLQELVKATCSNPEGLTKEVCIIHTPTDGRVTDANLCDVRSPEAICVLDIVRKEIAAGWRTSDTAAKSYRYGL